MSTYDNTPAARIRAYVNDDLVCEFGSSVERTDLAERHGASALRSGFESRFGWREDMKAGVFAVEAEDRRGLRARFFTRLPF